jgi:acyl-CoA thioesterase-2
VGDIEQQTAVEPMGDGRFVAMVHPDWEIWGPCGGYVAASPLVRPASFFCHYLSVASFAPVELEVTPLRTGRTVLAQRVAMSQEGRPVLDAMIWSVGEVEGLEHEDVDPPDVPDPDASPRWADLRPDEDRPAMRFWDNFDQRPLQWSEEWPPPGPQPPTWRAWVRPRPTASFEDPWVDAARSLIVLDVGSWPAGSRPHMYLEPPFIAPSLDLYAAFQYPGSASDWLLLDAHSPVAHGGLLSWTGRVWSRERRLIASGGGQAVFRHT